MNKQEIINTSRILQNDGVVIIPTDTIYGICCKAAQAQSVERIYSIKGRNTAKPFVVLIADYEDLSYLGCSVSGDEKLYLNDVWPGPLSAIIETTFLPHITRGKKSIAVRMPAEKWLRDIISATGPIVATSANISDTEYTHDLRAITDIFIDSVDYISTTNTPVRAASAIIDLKSKQQIR